MTHEQERAAVAQSLALDHDHGTYPMRRRCFLARFSDRPCDGRLVKAHLIPRQTLKREVCGATGTRLLYLDVVNDPRSWVWACGGPLGNAGHHGMLDASRTLRIPRDRLPLALEDFAAELGLGWWLDREYGPHG